MTLYKALIDIDQSILKKNRLEIKGLDEQFNLAMREMNLSSRETVAIFAYFLCQRIDTTTSFFTLTDDFLLDYAVSEAAIYINNFNELLNKKYFIPRNETAYIDDSFDPGFQFDVPFDLIDVLMHNKPLSEYNPKESEYKYDFTNFILSFDDIAIGTIRNTLKLKKHIAPFLEDEKVKILIKDIEGKKKDFLNFRNFAALIHGLFKSTNNIKLALDSTGFYSYEIIDFFYSVKEGENPIFKNEYLTLSGDILENSEFSWGSKITNEFGDKIFLLGETNDTSGMEKVENKDIKKKDLFYNPKNEKDIERLRKILDEDNYQKLRKRLDEKGFPKGLTILMYGPPGTGKTETIMQLAKETGRDIMHLSIEQVRSCWVGESEKNIKKIFDSYRKIGAKKKPILLFNEADAILSKRTSIGSRNASVEKMENTIQNIILEELEKFDGIFVAITNLVDNFDKAFERRFLYKLELQNPNFETKKKILKSKLPELEDDTVSEISQNYDLSGGQIDNISRKLEIDYILYGNKPTKKEIIDFCDKEKFDNDENKKVGFC